MVPDAMRMSQTVVVDFCNAENIVVRVAVQTGAVSEREKAVK